MIDKVRYSTQPDGFKNERNDCTVHALANSTGCSYKDAHACAELAGRKRTRGTRSYNVVNMAQKLGLATFTKIGLWKGGMMPVGSQARYPTLTEVLKRFPKGRYYARKRGHAFAIVDGVIVDGSVGQVGPRTRVKDLWKVEPMLSMTQTI